MKDKWKAVCRYWPWLVLLLGIDGLSALLLWLSDSGAFSVLAPVMLLVTVFLFGAAAVVLGAWSERSRRRSGISWNIRTSGMRRTWSKPSAGRKRIASGCWGKPYGKSSLHAQERRQTWKTMKNMWRHGLMR